MSMLSTRGAAAVSESMAILRGLAPDGGLYVPEDFPHFSMEEIAALGALDYQARALAILQKFLPDFTADELKNAIAGAYGTGFDDAQIAPVRPVGTWAHALELWRPAATPARPRWRVSSTCRGRAAACFTRARA